MTTGLDSYAGAEMQPVCFETLCPILVTTVIGFTVERRVRPHNATKGAAIGCLMNCEQAFLHRFLLPVCFAELNIEHDGRGLGVIHECPACTCSTTIMGVKSLVPHYLGNLSPHSCRGPLCIIARNRNAWHPDTHTKAVLR